jgi:uncharacterized NAD(P)/FAD-binding protein YdhS
MMAYLTRPGFKDGTPLKKDFPDMSNTEIIETTETSDVLVPPQKPGSQLTLNDEVEALKKILPAFEPKSQVYRVQKFLEKALEKGLIDQKDFNQGIESLQSDKVTKTITDFDEMVEEDATNK